MCISINCCAYFHNQDPAFVMYFGDFTIAQISGYYNEIAERIMNICLIVDIVATVFFIYS